MASFILIPLITLVLALFVYEPTRNFLIHQAREIEYIRKWLDISTVRIEPGKASFASSNLSGNNVLIQKSFTLINDSTQPIFRFRAYMSAVGTPVEDVDVFIAQNNSITANEFDNEKHNVCQILNIEINNTNGKLFNIYKIDPKSQVPFYIKAKPGTIVRFDIIEWDPEESGIAIENTSSSTHVFLTSNLGDREGRANGKFQMKGLKVMLFKYSVRQ